ncbi:MAG: M23 family metallopeptidase [Desulfomonile sp.]
MANDRAISIKFNKPRNGRKTRVLAVGLCLLVTGAVIYVWPSFGSKIPHSCDIRETSANKQPPPFGPTCAVNPDNSTKDKVDPMVNGSQEATDVTGPGDTLISILNDNLLDEASVPQVAESMASSIQNALNINFTPDTALPPGRRYSITIDSEGRFLKAVLELEPAHVFHASREDGAINSWKEEVVLDFKTEVACFEMKGSLSESIANAGEGIELALKLANVFRWDVDFHSESVKGDTLRVLFERRYADDRPSGYGRVLGAVYEGKKTGPKTAIYFNNEYYDEKGTELKKNFLRSPLSVIKITSRYGYRLHPVLKIWRKHNGVDYGSAQGTPVWAVSGGIVTFAGWNNGYGNYVCIKHDNGFESRYGHLQRFFVNKGQRVKQRQRIGLVGMTGIATGPHLDFQLLVNKKYMDPLKVSMVKSLRSVPTALAPRFSALAQDRLSCIKGNLLAKGSNRLTKLKFD